MKVSHTAFLLVRYAGLAWAFGGVLEATYIPEHFLAVAQSSSVAYRHVQQMAVFFLLVRTSLHVIWGSFCWAQAPRVARWLEGHTNSTPFAQSEAPISLP